jgi:hypothetical protein
MTHRTTHHLTARDMWIGAVALCMLLMDDAAAATTGATLGSGVGDTYLEHPPYYAGQRIEKLSGDKGRLGHLPVAFQRGASQPAIFDPRDGSGSSMDTLLEEMNVYLDALGVSAPLVAGRRVSAVVHEATLVPPDVRFGCIAEHHAPGGDCEERGDGALGRGRQEMLLAVGRPSSEWVAWIASVMNDQGVARALVVTLEIGQYFLRQEGLRGTKVLELGTHHKATLPWLTSLETPVSVLQLTAALVGPDGKAVRIGAEGFQLRRSHLLVSAVGGQELLGEEDIAAVRKAVRTDLPGQPLAWQAAMRELVTRVTGRAAQ